MTTTFETRPEQSLAFDRQSVSVDRAADPRRRLQELLDKKLEFIPNKCFSSKTADANILPESERHLAKEELPRDLPGDMPAHLARMCETELLTAEQEQVLFQRMNYLKYKAHTARENLDQDDPDHSSMNGVEALLEEAETVRDRIVRANIRLVISVVKKYVSPQNSFDEMLSDGIMTLMNAVDKFDYDRGFRFSTYAYRSIARSTFRLISARQKDQTRFATSQNEALLAEDVEETSGGLDEKSWEFLSGALSRMMRSLDRRERFIVRARYALGAHRKKHTFQAIADKLGVSKERTRQLEQRAVGKLKAMASEIQLDELFPA